MPLKMSFKGPDRTTSIESAELTCFDKLLQIKKAGNGEVVRVAVDMLN